MKKAVVIGGGTGTFVVLSALKKLANVDLTAIVTVADSGGSTGRLRDEFGFLPVGDIRQALAALAEVKSSKFKVQSRNVNNNWIRELLLYRFSKGEGLMGHNLGNLILTALQDMTGLTAKAVEIASKIFRLQGHIYPITTQNIQLVIEYADGTVEIGEKVLDDDKKHGGDRIVGIRTSPRAKIYRKAREEIEDADFVILGPGDLYGSILANFAVDGAAEAVKKSRAKFVYIVNLMTRYSQTHNMTAADLTKEVERYLERKVDIIVVNSGQVPKKLTAAYRDQNEFAVVDDLGEDKRVVRQALVTEAEVAGYPSDAVPRSYLRHNPEKLREVLGRIIQ